MKILVVDDEHSFAALLGHTLKRLGHKPVIAAHPDDALALLDDEVDAVITDIDMPVMNGVELALAIRNRMPEMPVAFCTGSAPESKTVHDAKRLGRVLPKVWTVADVKQLVGELARSAQPAAAPSRPRRASIARMYESAPSPTRDASTGAPPAVDASARRAARRVRITFKSWRKVRKLIADAERGQAMIGVPGPTDLDPGSPIIVSLALPGEITVRIAGEVQAIRPRSDGRPELVLDLKGLDRETAARLSALAEASEPAPESETGYLHVSPRRERLARGSDTPIARDPDEPRVSELIRGNRRLREQLGGRPTSTERADD